MGPMLYAGDCFLGELLAGSQCSSCPCLTRCHYMLTMSTQTASINNSLPPVAYTKAIDVWTGVCVTFVFGALLEYALVNYASRSDAQRLAKKKVQKQWEIDHQSFDPLHMEDALPPGPGQASAAANNGGSFAMKPMMRGNGPPPPPPPPGHSGSSGPPGHGMPPTMMSKLHHCEIHMKPKKHYNFLQSWLNKFPSMAKKIDVISRVTFPAIFAMFNLSYWCYYLTQEAHSESM